MHALDVYLPCAVRVSKSGAAIFNGEGATFQFKHEAVAAFIDPAAVSKQRSACNKFSSRLYRILFLDSTLLDDMRFIINRCDSSHPRRQAEGGGVYNAGSFSFSGPALFIQSSSGSAISNASPGNMK